MKAVLGECGKISILSATDAVNICLGHLVWWMRCQAGACNFFSVCVNAQYSVINDNELYFLGTGGLMDNISQREQSGRSQLFYLSVPRWSVRAPVDRLLSSHETFQVCGSYRCEQKHISSWSAWYPRPKTTNFILCVYVSEPRLPFRDDSLFTSGRFSQSRMIRCLGSDDAGSHAAYTHWWLYF